MKKGAKIKMSEIQLRRKIYARKNVSSKRDQNLTKQLDEKQKALEDAIKVLKNLVWNKIFIGRMEKRYDLFRISKKDKECI